MDEKFKQKDAAAKAKAAKRGPARRAKLAKQMGASDEQVAQVQKAAEKVHAPYAPKE